MKHFFLALLALICSARALTLPPGFSAQNVAGGWIEPVGVAFDPDPAAVGRMYVWERTGRIWIVENGVKLATPLLDLSEEVGGWRDFGLLGVALHPNFHENGYIFLSYVVDRHHLLNAGTAAYNAGTNQYFAATIGRITRYTARAVDGFRSVDPASRKVLLGESKTTGFPILWQSHGTGALVFGNDSTLLASCGESASYDQVDDGTNPSLTYAAQALADGIITAKENIGAFRSQLVDSLGGKIIRIDPETGNGVPGNPFYDAARPRSARSRVWTLGLRNPFRFTIKPGSGSHAPAEANPGVILLGDVGWGAWEEIDVIDGPAKNCGWPLFEGLTPHDSFGVLPLANPDAPNPLGGFFKFRDLLIQETLAAPSWPNPLNPAQQVPAGIPRFMHTRPILDAGHLSDVDGRVRVPIFNDTTAGETLVGAPGSPVTGPQYGANASVGGVFYTGSDFPARYRGTYFHADFGHGWVRNFVLNAQNRPTQVSDFASGGSPVFVGTHPTLGGLYVVDYASGLVQKIVYAPGGNRAPTAVAGADVTIGAAPLRVTFSSAGSADPDGQSLTYSWDFGDGTTSALPAPTHDFSATGARRFDVTLTVTDAGDATAQARLQIFVNHSLPAVTLLSPIDGTKYPLTGDTEYALTRRILEVPGHPTTSEWKVFLHHNEHEHGEPAVVGAEAAALISPVYSTTETYYFRIQLTVTDDLGAKVIRETHLYPNAANLAPQAAWSQARRTLLTSAAPRLIDGAAAISDEDSPGIEFGRLRVALPAPRLGDVLSILPEGEGRGQVSVEGNKVGFSGVIVATQSGGQGATPLVVIFNEAATPAIAQAILRRVAGTFARPGSREVVANIDDGDGGVRSAGSLLLLVNTPTNVPPVISLRRPANQAIFSAPAAIAITADASDADGSVTRVEFFANAQKLGELTAPPFVFVWNGVSPGSYALTARALDNASGVTVSTPVNITVAGANPVPNPWHAQDIGTAAGLVNFGGNLFTVRGAGAGMDTSADALHFVWQPWDGDGTIVAKVESLRPITALSFGGLMFRESLLPGARQVSLCFQANSRAILRWRDGTPATLQKTIALTPAVPGWLKLTRRGNSFTSFTSTDGTVWTPLRAATLDLPAQCLVGLTVSSAGGSGDRNIVVFSNATLAP